MTYVITSPCVDNKDASCVEVCPVDCIYEIDRMRLIHPDECIDCGACELECPVEAIQVQAAVAGAERPYIAVNAAIADGVVTADAALDRVITGGAAQAA